MITRIVAVVPSDRTLTTAPRKLTLVSGNSDGNCDFHEGAVAELPGSRFWR